MNIIEFRILHPNRTPFAIRKQDRNTKERYLKTISEGNCYVSEKSIDLNIKILLRIKIYTREEVEIELQKIRLNHDASIFSSWKITVSETNFNGLEKMIEEDKISKLEQQKPSKASLMIYNKDKKTVTIKIGETYISTKFQEEKNEERKGNKEISILICYLKYIKVKHEEIESIIQYHPDDLSLSKFLRGYVYSKIKHEFNDLEHFIRHLFTLIRKEKTYVKN